MGKAEYVDTEEKRKILGKAEYLQETEYFG